MKTLLTITLAAFAYWLSVPAAPVPQLANDGPAHWVRIEDGRAWSYYDPYGTLYHPTLFILLPDNLDLN